MNDWKEARRKGIGGSDAAAILGLSPWKSAMDVWLEKMDLATEVTDPSRTFLLTLGTELEPVIAKLYSQETGRQLYKPMAPYVHPKYPVLRGNPDRLVVDGLRGVELKTENQFTNQFGEPGTDEVPFHYLVQCAHYMAVCDYPVWDVALLRGGATFSIYTIHRDLELEKDMREQLLAWWEKHIVGKEPPDVDGSGAWKTYLRKKFPADILPVVEADKNILSTIDSLKSVRSILDKYEGVKDALENRLKLVIGEHEGIEGSFGRITWKKSKDTSVTDWDAVYSHIVMKFPDLASQIADIVIEDTTLKPGSRRFLFKVKEGWTYGQRTIESGGQDRHLPGHAPEVQDGDREGAPETPLSRTHGPRGAYKLPSES